MRRNVLQTVFEGGNLIIRAETEGERGLVCSMDAIAAWRALLGTTSVAETCAAMMPGKGIGRLVRSADRTQRVHDRL